jgi:uncharacterized protein YdhG (YjbR/CyaY superfamily)
MMISHKAASVNEYIAGFPEEIQNRLQSVRETIKKTAPEAEEVISYQMPAYKLNGILVYFAACKNHLGFYPASTGIASFTKELEGYKTSKGAVQFPYDQPVPMDLISRIVAFRVAENQEKKARKKG